MEGTLGGDVRHLRLILMLLLASFVVLLQPLSLFLDLSVLLHKVRKVDWRISDVPYV